MDTSKKRLFFGMEIEAPWPVHWPKGRMLKEANLHVTLAFLGSVFFEDVKSILPVFPAPSFSFGPCGSFDACLFLPLKESRAAAWHIDWPEPSILAFQKRLVHWLGENKFSVSSKSWLPHVTLCRRPFEANEWKDHFRPLPCCAGTIHLYEHVASLTYRSLWSWPLLPPFKEIEHAADLAFHVYGEDVHQLYLHAFWALCFKHPLLLGYFQKPKEIESVEQIVIHLNQAISHADQELGCPFKAVSFHGEVEPFAKKFMQWEMIVDV